MTAKLSLRTLYRQLEKHYGFYTSGEISEKEYLHAIRPIDKAIGEREMSMLRDSPVLKESSSRHFLKQ